MGGTSPKNYNNTWCSLDSQIGLFLLIPPGLVGLGASLDLALSQNTPQYGTSTGRGTEPFNVFGGGGGVFSRYSAKLSESVVFLILTLKLFRFSKLWYAFCVSNLMCRSVCLTSVEL